MNNVQIGGDSGRMFEVNGDDLLSGIAHGFAIPNSHSTSLP
jgi:hypothetical protein